jgi:hypothetical protein
MTHDWKTTTWRQFGASIDMLENAVRACPDELWAKLATRDISLAERWYDYWYLVFHTLFWLDFYLSETSEDFAPPAPFGLEEIDPNGAYPPRPYTKDELLAYLEHGRQKLRLRILNLTEETAAELSRSSGRGLSVVETLLYTMRHVQHHVAQLNLILRHNGSEAPKWVSFTEIELND